MARDPVATALALARPHVGPISSAVGGRTDHHAIDVPAESFVIPADVVSSLGQGNTDNGMLVLKRMFPAAGSKAQGVPIMAAGGEFVVSPENVARAGDGNIRRGHKVLEAFVKHARAEHIKTLKKLPNPAR